MSKRNSGAALFVADRVDRTLGSDAVHRKEACDRSDQQAEHQQQDDLTGAEMEQRHQKIVCESNKNEIFSKIFKPVKK